MQTLVISQIEEYKQQIALYVKKKAELEKEEKLTSDIKDALNFVIDLNLEKISAAKQFKSPNTKLRVVFHESGKIIYCETAKETYIASIKELGLEMVIKYFPSQFDVSSKNGTDTVYLGAFTYLKVGLSNIAKKNNLERFARMMNRKITVTILD